MSLKAGQKLLSLKRNQLFLFVNIYYNQRKKEKISYLIQNYTQNKNPQTPSTQFHLLQNEWNQEWQDGKIFG